MSRGGVVFAVVLAAAAAAGLWFLVGSADRGRAPDVASEEGAAESADGTQVPGLLGSRKAPVDLPAGTPLKLKGSVTDAKGAAVAGVRVTARRTGPVWDAADPKTWNVTGQKDSFVRSVEAIDSPGRADPAPDGESKSGGDGAFEMTFRESGNYEVTARPEAPQAGTRASAALTAAKPEAKVKLQVLDGNAFHGKVVDSADRPLAAAVRATMWSEDRAQTLFAPTPVFTDASTGEFGFEGVPAGKLSLAVTLPGRMSASGFEAAVPYDGVYVLRVPAGGGLQGRVSNAAGEAVAGADLVAQTKESGSTLYGSARAKSGGDGTWRMEGVLPGRVTSLAVSAAGYTLLQQSPPRAPWSGAEVKVGEDTTIDVVLKRGGIVAGRVTEQGTGAGVPDVQIQLARAEMSTSWYGPGPAVATDGEGRFRFDDVALGKYLLLPQSATHWFAAVETAIVAGSTGLVYDPSGSTPNPTPQSLTVVLTKEGETAERNLEARRGLPLKGRVIGPDGQGVDGATVTSSTVGFGNVAWQWGVQAYGGDSIPLATSGPDGRFTIPGLAPRDSWVLVASKEDLVGVPSDPVRVAADAPASDVTLRVVAGAALAGRVIDSDGKGLSGWMVWFYNPQGGMSRRSQQATTEADGSFRLRGLPAGKGQLQTYSPTGGRSTQVEIDPPLAAGEAREGIEVRIESGVEISGVLVDGEGKPLGAQGLSANGMGASRPWSTWTSTKADGTFTLKGVPKGKVQVNASVATDAGYSESQAVGDPIDAPASNVRLVFAPRKKTRISARVTDDKGRPVPLVVVSLEGRSRPYYAQANPDEVVNGEMAREVDGTPPYTLIAAYPRDEWGRALNLKSKRVVVSDPAVTAVIEMEPGAEIAGTVIGPDGKGVPAANVSGGGTQAQTDEEGRFRLLGIVSDAESDIVVRPPQRYVTPPTARAKPGVTDLVIRLTLGASISGRVVGPDGEPATNASVQASWKSPSTGRTGSAGAALQAGGRFRLEGLAEDAVATVTVQSWSPVGGETLRPAQAENVRAGTEDLVLRLERGVSIEGRVVYADGRPATYQWVMVARVDKPASASNSGMPTDASTGAFKVSGLEPGTYLLTAMSSRGMRMGEPLKVDAPAREVRLVVAAPVKLAGRVEGAAAGAEYVVVVWPADGDPDTPGRQSTKMAADGTFALDVPADKDLYAAVMYGPDDRYALVGPIKAGTAEVTLRLVPGAAIEGVVEDSAGVPKAGASIYARSPQWRAYAKTDAMGRFRLKALPPGRFTLTTRQDQNTIPLGDADAGATGLRYRLPP